MANPKKKEIQRKLTHEEKKKLNALIQRNSEKGKTRELIPELVGWVKASGYEAETKPESFVASCVADRLSK